jgi:hypothetical protein
MTLQAYMGPEPLTLHGISSKYNSKQLASFDILLGFKLGR